MRLLVTAAASHLPRQATAWLIMTLGRSNNLAMPAPRYDLKRSATITWSFDNYEYDILEGDEVVALYWHDYRGDEHGIAFVGGTKTDNLPGRVGDYLEGGGTGPRILSQLAVDYIDQHRPKKPSMKIELDVIQIVKTGEFYYVAVSFDGTTGSLGYYNNLQEAIERPLCEGRMSERAQAALRTIQKKGEECDWDEVTISKAFPENRK